MSIKEEHISWSYLLEEVYTTVDKDGPFRLYETVANQGLRIAQWKVMNPEYLKSLFLRWETIIDKAERGELEDFHEAIFEFFQDEMVYVFIDRCYRFACINNHIHIVEYMLRRGYIPGNLSTVEKAPDVSDIVFLLVENAVDYQLDIENQDSNELDINEEEQKPIQRFIEYMSNPIIVEKYLGNRWSPIVIKEELSTNNNFFGTVMKKATIETVSISQLSTVIVQQGTISSLFIDIQRFLSSQRSNSNNNDITNNNNGEDESNTDNNDIHILSYEKACKICPALSTTLHYIQIAKTLLYLRYRLGLNANSMREPDGYSPLHVAALHGLYEIAISLTLCGADVNSIAIDESTPLGCCIEGQSEYCNDKNTTTSNNDKNTISKTKTNNRYTVDTKSTLDFSKRFNHLGSYFLSKGGVSEWKKAVKTIRTSLYDSTDGSNWHVNPEDELLRMELMNNIPK